MKQDKARNGPFSKLNKQQQTLIMLDFEGGLSNKEIAPKIGLKNETTVSHWRAREWYQPAYDDYMRLMIKGTIKSAALQTLLNLLHAKSEMARYQASIAILKMAGMFNENDNPDLIAAKVRRANAEAKIAEWKAGELTRTNKATDKTTLVDDIGGMDDGQDD